MWDLDDQSNYIKVHSFSIPHAFTYADTREGKTDKDKREYIRARASEGFPQNIPGVQWWAFRISVKKSGGRPFDVENVPKLIIDAFSESLISKDQSQYKTLCLFPDDTIDHVRVLEVSGVRSQQGDRMEVEIFGKKQLEYVS